MSFAVDGCGAVFAATALGPIAAIAASSSHDCDWGSCGDYGYDTGGILSAEAGRASQESVEQAVRDALAGRVAAVVTGPVSKEVNQLDGIPVGVSSGAIIWAALQVAKRPENKGKLIVMGMSAFATLPDRSAPDISFVGIGLIDK